MYDVAALLAAESNCAELVDENEGSYCECVYVCVRVFGFRSVSLW